MNLLVKRTWRLRRVEPVAVTRVGRPQTTLLDDRARLLQHPESIISAAERRYTDHDQHHQVNAQPRSPYARLMNHNALTVCCTVLTGQDEGIGDMPLVDDDGGTCVSILLFPAQTLCSDAILQMKKSHMCV